jgi:hypothetical protein
MGRLMTNDVELYAERNGLGEWTVVDPAGSRWHPSVETALVLRFLELSRTETEVGAFAVEVAQAEPNAGTWRN